MHNDLSNAAIGIDLGGTSTRIAVVDASGSVLARLKRSTERGATAERTVRSLADDVSQLLAECGTAATNHLPLGLAVPGTLDRARKKLVRSVNLPQLEGFALIDELCRRTRLTASLFTDAEATTWGEYAARKPRVKRFIHLRLGTGIACGIVIDGELKRLDADRTTHLEPLVVDHGPDAVRCVCGLSGCLETIASGAVLSRRATKLGLGNNLGDIQRAAVDRDEKAMELIRRTAHSVFTAIENLSIRFHPEVICLGGGVLLHLPALGRAINDVIESRPGRPLTVTGELGDDAGVTGAAQLAKRSAQPSSTAEEGVGRRPGSSR